MADHTGGAAEVRIEVQKTAEQEAVEFWLGTRQGLLQQVDYIERYHLRGVISLRTAELRKKAKAGRKD